MFLLSVCLSVCLSRAFSPFSPRLDHVRLLFLFDFLQPALVQLQETLHHHCSILHAKRHQLTCSEAKRSAVAAEREPPSCVASASKAQTADTKQGRYGLCSGCCDTFLCMSVCLSIYLYLFLSRVASFNCSQPRLHCCILYSSSYIPVYI